MVSYVVCTTSVYYGTWVLILVVVDDGLVRYTYTVIVNIRFVLILVVVDDGLVLNVLRCLDIFLIVLILVVVDDGLVHSAHCSSL